MLVPFTKVQALGNDLILIDAVQRASLAALPWTSLAPTLCDRHTGIGADGILVLSPALDETHAHVALRIVNSDGSEGQMCGNGIRCVARYALERLGHDAAGPLHVRTPRGVVSVGIRMDARGRFSDADVDMGPPDLDPSCIPVALAGPRAINVPLPAELHAIDPAWWAQPGAPDAVSCVSMGNPHAVFFCDLDLARIPLERLGPALERHSLFPTHTNVHFARVRSRTDVLVRTWERGAGATRACGTGACAVVVSGVLTGRLENTTRAHLPGGVLDVVWPGQGIDPMPGVRMRGPAHLVYDGTIMVAD